MSETGPTCPPVHFPCSKDQTKLDSLYREFYGRHAATLTVKSLDKEKSRVHSFYNDTRTKDRKYLSEAEVLMFGPFEPYLFSQTFWGIDQTRSLIFTASRALLDDAGLELKAGDLILYQGVFHEVLTVKRKEDSYFDQRGYNFEWAVATYVPNEGS